MQTYCSGLPLLIILLAQRVFERMPLEGFVDAKNVLLPRKGPGYDSLLSIQDCEDQASKTYKYYLLRDPPPRSDLCHKFYIFCPDSDSPCSTDHFWSLHHGPKVT
ncbi:unnamed protein product [Oikopleura dioica]|uniref:Uncharacterized protein n=1 Tax=Oikopleura dioica TaxID=34765 RepID=E4YKJ8_OIKDI|nr:unnamed protein product [Oikopleura dioica]